MRAGAAETASTATAALTLADGAPTHVSSGGRKLVAGVFVAIIVIAVVFVLWLKTSRDEE